MGRRVARFKGSEASVEQLVGAMTGALSTEEATDPAQAAGSGEEKGVS
jgi:hypothetical protein